MMLEVCAGDRRRGMSADSRRAAREWALYDIFLEAAHRGTPLSALESIAVQSAHGLKRPRPSWYPVPRPGSPGHARASDIMPNLGCT